MYILPPERSLSDCVQATSYRYLLFPIVLVQPTSIGLLYLSLPRSKSFSPRALSPCFSPPSCEPVLATVGKKTLSYLAVLSQEICHPYINWLCWCLRSILLAWWYVRWCRRRKTGCWTQLERQTLLNSAQKAGVVRRSSKDGLARLSFKDRL